MRNIFKNAIKRKGGLTRTVGGKPSEHMESVKKLAKDGTPLQKKQANFFLNILNKSKKKSRGRLLKRIKGEN